ncbi:MAG TPA: hypothetical protein VHI13_17400 [Candidatus Kapabacteria bacterium]|nr:hypothetical protein [Candidatus Kapabacteria bacterium]
MSGTITDGELDQFQSLLERVPEYMAELRDTLELRSLLHDDALTLTPPADLSEHVRIAVSSSFAADAITEFEEVSRRRRAFLFPLRITAGALVAVCLAVSVALTPTLPRGTFAAKGNQSVQSGRMADNSIDAASPGNSRDVKNHGNMPAPHVRMNPAHAPAERPGISVDAHAATARPDVLADAGTAHTETVSTAHAAHTDGYRWLVDHEIPIRMPATEADAHNGSIASNDLHRPSNPALLGGSGSEGMISRDPMDLLMRTPMRSGYNPLIDSATRHESQPAIQSEATPGEAIASVTPNDWHLMTIGVTLGAGSIIEKVSPTALLQNSYYFSFSLSGGDRIGVEMGASTFERESKSSSPFGAAKRNSNDNIFLASNLPVSGGGGGSYLGVVDNAQGSQAKGLGKYVIDDTPTNGDLPTKDLPPVPKRGSDMKDNSRSYAVDPTEPSGPVPTPAPAHLLEQQITYGAVFYDHRFKLGKRWDVCGRVTVGAADDGLVSSFRTYAAYSPGTRNISLTMGVGSSTLFSLSPTREKTVSTNYGVYYGVELGF